MTKINENIMKLDNEGLAKRLKMYESESAMLADFGEQHSTEEKNEYNFIKELLKLKQKYDFN